MSKRVNLLEGNVFKALINLALPIMGTSLIQMAYNMIDMIWIGRLGSAEVAAVGTAGFYMWMAIGIILISKIGGQVKVAQLFGEGDILQAKKYVKSTLQLILTLAVLYSLIIITQADILIKFFNINDKYVFNKAVTYLTIIGYGIVFSFVNQAMTGIITGTGNSKTPFIITTVGLIFNIVLDPILIFGIGPFPTLGVKGAALATIISQGLVSLFYIVYTTKDDLIFSNIKLFSRPDLQYIIDIAKIGFPAAVQSILFTFISMLIARIIAAWGPVAIAVQKVGSQVEAISYMSSDGFSSALNSFIGQNYGAKKYDRVKKGYFTALKTISGLGVFTTFLLVVFPGTIFRIFIPDPDVTSFGIAYLRILGASQLFMCVEIITHGAFAGYGKTIPPSVIGITFNSLRIPLALLLSSTILGLNGVWWSISITSFLKGIVLVSWFIYFINKKNMKI